MKKIVTIIVTFLTVNLSFAQEIEKLSYEQSREIVKTMTSLTPTNVYEINQKVAGSEYRGRVLPLYRITSYDKNNEEINVYLNPYSGKIEAIRTLSWRIWDFLWGLHIIDWSERDNINNIFLNKFFSNLSSSTPINIKKYVFI